MTPPTTEPREAPRRLARPEREKQVLEVAHRLFAERGYSAVTMDEIARRVGVTKPLLYAYFGNKEGLYLDCMAPDGEALCEAVIESVARAGHAADALAGGVRAVFDFVDSDRDAWRVLFDETLPAGGEVATAAGHFRDRITAVLREQMRAVLAPELRAHPQSSEAIEALSLTLMAATEAMVRWWLKSNGGLSAAQAAQLLIATVEPGLRNIAGPAAHGEPTKTKHKPAKTKKRDKNPK